MKNGTSLENLVTCIKTVTHFIGQIGLKLQTAVYHVIRDYVRKCAECKGTALTKSFVMEIKFTMQEEC